MLSSSRETAVTTGTENWLAHRWGKWVVPYAALWITMLSGGVIVVALALWSAEVYDNVVDEAGLANLDKPTLAFMEQLRSPGLDSFVTGFTNIGGGVGMIAAGVIFIAAMGMSRVFLGHHWMTDVIMGWVLGLAWVGIVIMAHRF